MRGFMLCLMVLAASAGGAQADRAGAIAAECKLLEHAHAATAKAQGAAPSAILFGCPGHERLADDTTRKQDRQRFSAAMRAQVPVAAKAFGRPGKMLFQRMISRGVPVDLATALTEDKAFKAAVAASQ